MKYYEYVTHRSDINCWYKLLMYILLFLYVYDRFYLVINHNYVLTQMGQHFWFGLNTFLLKQNTIF
jgi:hypothetical protein